MNAIKLVVKKGKLRDDGTRLVSVQYCHTAKKRVVIGTGIAIPPQYWNKKSSRISASLPSTFGNVDDLEKKLTEKLRKAEDMVRTARQRKVCPMDFLKLNFPLSDKWTVNLMKEKKNELDVFHQIDLYIESRKSEVKKSTIKIIGVMKTHLRQFELFRGSSITFDSFDFQFYKDFVKFLTYDYVLMRRKEKVKGLRINTFGKTIKWLKIFLLDRIAKKSFHTMT